MWVFCGIAFLSLIASGISYSQVPAEWDQWVEDGLSAEDDSKYKDAEKLFGQACDVSLAQMLGSERLTRACLMLSRTYAVQGKWSKAADAARALVQAQAQFADSRPEDRAEALIRAAEADMADGDYDAATASIRQAADLTRELDLEAAAAAFVDISTFYMPAGPKGFGGDVLDAALRALMAQPNKDTAIYVATAAKVGRGLGAFERWEDATKLLLPLVEAAEKRFDVKPAYDELWGAYQSAASVVIAGLKALGDDRQADRVRELREGWPSKLNPRSGEALPPRLAHKVEPQYTAGARSNRIQGLVLLSIVVGADGRAHDIEVLKSLPYGLPWEAVRAIRKWRFKPGTLNGEAVSVRAQIEVHFRVF